MIHHRLRRYEKRSCVDIVYTIDETCADDKNRCSVLKKLSNYRTVPIIRNAGVERTLLLKPSADTAEQNANTVDPAGKLSRSCVREEEGRLNMRDEFVPLQHRLKSAEVFSRTKRMSIPVLNDKQDFKASADGLGIRKCYSYGADVRK